MLKRPSTPSPRFRRGLVQIEILMGLIIYCSLLMVLLVIGSAARAVVSAQEQARAGAWDQRLPQATGAPLPIDTLSLGRFLGPGATAPVRGGLLSAEGRGELLPIFPQFTTRLVNPTRVAWTVGGAWDFHRIRFREGPGQHPPLTPDPQTHRALGGEISIRKWQTLGE